VTDSIVSVNIGQIRRIWSKIMHYLFVDSETICRWCKEPMMQVVEDQPNNPIVKLCPVCDRWPPDFLERGSKEK